MTVSIRDAQNSPQDRTWIQAQYPEYLEDLSQQSMNTGMFPAQGEHGEREQELMARWFADDTSHPLIILKNDKPAGFALVSRPPRHQRAQVDFRMADFFITPRSRRLGIGRDAAALIFNRFAGTWEIVEFVYNKPAVAVLARDRRRRTPAASSRSRSRRAKCTRCSRRGSPERADKRQAKA